MKTTITDINRGFNPDPYPGNKRLRPVATPRRNRGVSNVNISQYLLIPAKLDLYI